MTGRARALASVLVVAVALGAGYIAWRRTGAAPSAPGVGLEMLRFVPRSATLVGAADVRTLVRSGLGATLRGVPVARRQDLQERTGIDLEADVDTLVVAAVPATGSGMTTGAVLARGRFEGARLEALMTSHGATAEVYKGTRLLVAPALRPGAAPEALALVEPGLVAFGEASFVKAMLDTAAGGPGVLTNAAFMKVIRPIADGQVWIAGRYDPALQGGLSTRVRIDLPPIEWLSLTGRIGDGLRVEIRADATDADAARQLRDTVNGVLVFARPQLASRPEWRALANSLTLGGADQAVTLSFEASAPTAVALAALVPFLPGTANRTPGSPARP